MAGMAKEMKKADGAWMFDHAMPPISRHTARSHREPHGWYVDTRKALLGATATATKADVHLHQVTTIDGPLQSTLCVCEDRGRKMYHPSALLR